jgi:hypothetical protein
MVIVGSLDRRIGFSWLGRHGFQATDLLGHRQIDKVIEGNSIFGRKFLSTFSQRRCEA